MSKCVKDHLICNPNHPWKSWVTWSSLWNPLGPGYPLISPTGDWYCTSFHLNSMPFNTCLNIYVLLGPVLGPGILLCVLYEIFVYFMSSCNFTNEIVSFQRAGYSWCFSYILSRITQHFAFRKRLMVVANQLNCISKSQCYSLIYYYFAKSYKPEGQVASCFLNEYLFHISDSFLLYHRNSLKLLFWFQLLPSIHYPSFFLFFTDLCIAFKFAQICDKTGNSATPWQILCHSVHFIKTEEAVEN